MRLEENVKLKFPLSFLLLFCVQKLNFMYIHKSFVYKRCETATVMCNLFSLNLKLSESLDSFRCAKANKKPLFLTITFRTVSHDLYCVFHDFILVLL